MVHCLAINCTNYSSKCKGWDKKIKFHQIPKDINLRKKWITAIKTKDPPLTDKSCVCSDHFLESDYKRDLKAELLGTPIGQILGFNFDPNARNSNQWTQVPIQIDEMHYQSCPHPPAYSNNQQYLNMRDWCLLHQKQRLYF